MTDPLSPLLHQTWPHQSECMTYYGNPYRAGWLHANTVDVPCPWQLYYGETPVEHILIHHKCAPSLVRILNYIWAECDNDADRISALHYDWFSGSYNLRPIRGGTHISMHGFACAIDFDAQENPFHSTHHKFQPTDLIVRAFEAEGWTWGGRWRSPDAMHFQAARL